MIGSCVLVVGILAWKMCPVSGPTAVPALPKQWHEQVYGLDEGEVVRFIPPPYSAGRVQSAASFLAVRGVTSSQPRAIRQLAFGISARGPRYSIASTMAGTVVSAIQACTNLNGNEYDLEWHLNDLPADGDWMVNLDASVDRRMTALVSVLSQINARNLIVDTPLISRQVIVARGRWEFRPPEVGSPTPGIPTRNQLYVHLFVQSAELNKPNPLIGAGALTTFLELLQNLTHQKILDEIEEPRPQSVRWALHQGMDYSQAERWKLLFANVEKQTSLKFEKVTRRMPYWIVREAVAATQPTRSP